MEAEGCATRPDSIENQTNGSAMDSARGPEVVELHLEELGERSWLRSLANTMLGTSGSAQFRFVAHAVDRLAHANADDHCPRSLEPVRVGATFPVMRWQDLNDRTTPNAWLEVAEARLEEFDRDLVAEGWRRSDDLGRHWWSRRYERLCSSTGS